MADVSTTTGSYTGVLHSIADGLRAFSRALITVPHAQEKMRQVEALLALSDEELAQRGLRRHDIARYVFGGSPL